MDGGRKKERKIIWMRKSPSCVVTSDARRDPNPYNVSIYMQDGVQVGRAATHTAQLSPSSSPI